MQNLHNPALRYMTLLLVMVWLAGTAWAFWWFQLRYLQPAGSAISLQVDALLQDLPPLPLQSLLLVHFYDPDCLCSRFNEAHARTIMQAYSQQGIHFLIAVPDAAVLAEAEQTFGFPAFVSQVPPEQLSSPLALVLDADRQPVYLGSYSDKTGCTSDDGRLVENTLDALLAVDARRTPSQVSGGCRCPWPEPSLFAYRN